MKLREREERIERYRLDEQEKNLLKEKEELTIEIEKSPMNTGNSVDGINEK